MFRYALLAVIAGLIAVGLYTYPITLDPYAAEIAEAQRESTVTVAAGGSVEGVASPEQIAAGQRARELWKKTEDINSYMAMLSNALSIISAVLSTSFAWLGYRAQRVQSGR
jgi:hypothetical protein